MREELGRQDYDRCPYCKQQVIKAITQETRAEITLDPEPGYDGNWTLRRGEDGQLWVKMTESTGQHGDPNSYVGHLLVCPKFPPRKGKK